MTEAQVVKKNTELARKRIAELAKRAEKASKDAEILYSDHILPLPDWATKEGREKQNEVE
ncbi:MAG: hypothetical protein LBM27_00185 [Lactobacillaceae bacterium]|nr:hypothetical protein [Lactobacillaceae bacterium]